MTDLFSTKPDVPQESEARLDRIRAGLSRRHAREKRFRLYGVLAIAAALAFVAILFTMILSKGLPAFQQATLSLPVTFSEELIDVDPQPVREAGQSAADFQAAFRKYCSLVAAALSTRLSAEQQASVLFSLQNEFSL